MFDRQQQRGRMKGREMSGEMASETGTDPFVIAAGVSVVLSQYLYFMRGNREMGIFVGLWPPTFLAFGSYFNQLRMKQKVDYLTGSNGLMAAIDKIMGR